MPPPKPWVLQIEPDVVKAMARIPKDVAKRIFDEMHRLPTDPFAGDVQKLKGRENVWRRRIGSYRIFYKLFTKERVILVFHVERRTSTTYD